MTNKLHNFGLAVIVAIFITACGGGADNPLSPPQVNNNSVSNPAPTNNDSEELIIDNGRGLSNNQDTEKPK